MLAPRKDESPVHYWISLWPAAPLFGVKWRFESVVPVAPFLNPAEVMARMAKVGGGAKALAAETGERGAAEALEEIVETAHDSVEDALDTAVGATQMLADEAGGFEAEIDAPYGDVAPPPNLFAERPAQVDDLKQIKGVGPKLEAMLNMMGIWRLDQIAGFTPQNLAWVDENLTSFKGRPLRDDWVAQAKALL